MNYPKRSGPINAKKPTKHYEHLQRLSIHDEYITPYAAIRFSKKINSRGVFATATYKKGEIIEIAPGILQDLKFNLGNLSDYTFGCGDKHVLMGCGFTPMYNHSDDPNAGWETINNNKVKITALKNIDPDEEIFISYGENYFIQREYLTKTE
jgi:hypothetical protein